jgi:putative DNA primase/helicase
VTAAVDASQRYTRARRCPICDGAEADPRGQGKRCTGFLSDDGAYARCSREEQAGALEIEDATQTYPHRLAGDCRCGTSHDGGAQRSERGDSAIVATYPYRDESGSLLFEVVRFASKKFKQRRPDGRGDWTWSLGNVRRVLYRLPELVAAKPEATVYVVEGERDVESMVRLGVVATTNPGGAGKWRSEYGETLRDRRVIVIPDVGDKRQEGEKHADQVAKALTGTAASVRILKLPGPGKDATDWIAAGGTADKLRELVERVRHGAVSMVRMSDVAAEDVSWLWPGRIPAGMISVLDGPPKVGKSSVVVDLAARITTGRSWPVGFGTNEPRAVILIGHEDSPAHTIRPRLDAAGADPALVHLLTEISGRLPELPTDVDEIEKAIVSTRAALVVFDPISAYLGGADLHRDNEVRAALAPLAAVAERTGAAILFLRHLRKSGGVDAISRGLGSVAIGALARCMMMVLADPDDDAAKLLTWPAINVAAQPQSIRWRFDVAPTGKPPRIAWDTAACDLTADQVLDRQDEARREPGALQAAIDFLREQLADGPRPSRDLEEAARGAHNSKTLERARKKMGAPSRKVGKIWYVHPPRSTTPPVGGDVGVVGLVDVEPGEDRQDRQERQESPLGDLSVFPDGEVI